MAFTLMKQDACFVDTRIVQGITSKLHYVVRRTPFSLHIAASGKRDLNKGRLDLTLLHDSADLKPVEENPLQFLARPSEDGSSAVIECRILELSSHSAAKAFKLRVAHVVDGLSAEVLTDPIVSTAKQQQIRNRRAEVEKSLHRDAEDQSQRVAKRARSEDVMCMLTKIAGAQERQQKLLERTLSSKIVVKVEDAPAALSLEEALDALLRAYDQEDVAERPRKLRRLVASRRGNEHALLEIGSVLSASRRGSDESQSSDFDFLESPLNSQADPHSYRLRSAASSAALLGLPDEFGATSSSSPGGGLYDDFGADFLQTGMEF